MVLYRGSCFTCRVNQSMTPILVKYTSSRVSDFLYKNHNRTEFSINITIHKSVGTTPSEMFVREVNQRTEFCDGLREKLEEFDKVWILNWRNSIIRNIMMEKVDL